MCSVAHVAAGVLIGSFFDNRLTAFVVGFASHIPLDLVPHIDFEDFRMDALATVGLLGAVLIVSGFSPMFVCAAGAVAPDLENLLWKTGIIEERRKVFPTHSGLIRHGRTVAGKGFAVEVVISALCAGLVALVMLLRGGSN
jgi:hypothetical protein